ncbi:hypothetical protein AB0H00_15810 [Nocardia sp. NPDC023852]|uniref:hypothetical protein n=1 Tax=Nocardia sp. NPDC023852 TaxID=3154697 RepID=UPI0033D525AD
MVMGMAFQVTAIITSINVPLYSGTFNSDLAPVTTWTSKIVSKARGAGAIASHSLIGPLDIGTLNVKIG